MYLMAQNIQINFGSCHPTAKPPGGVTSIRKILVKMRNKVKHVCVPSSVPSLETNYTNWLVNKYAKSTSHYDQPQQSSAFVPHQGGSWKYCIRLAYVVVEVPKTSLILQIICTRTTAAEIAHKHSWREFPFNNQMLSNFLHSPQVFDIFLQSQLLWSAVHLTKPDSTLILSSHRF